MPFMAILTLHCPDRPGIGAKVATCLHENGCNIEESAQFHDKMTNRFFMRVLTSKVDASVVDTFCDQFVGVADSYDMDWHFHDAETPVKTLIMVSQEDHCLHDLLYRIRSGHINMDVVAIVSNHDNCRLLAERYGISFYHMPITPDNKPAQEATLKEIASNANAELIILARYMQILSDDVCKMYHGRMINIHHSFLPGFKGARPYTQAYERGVKMIGATAHFVTKDLDEGPIIAQETLSVTHADTAQDLRNKGRDIEARVLSAAAALYAERRVFLHNGRTVIL